MGEKGEETSPLQECVGEDIAPMQCLHAVGSVSWDLLL
jgi:hypothetical protein